MEPGVELKEGEVSVDEGAGSIKNRAGPVVETVTANGSPKESVAKLTAEQLAAIEDEEALDRMLDETSDFEERKLIRAAMRELRKRKREVLLGLSQQDTDQREQERTSRQQPKEEQKVELKVRPGGGDAGGVLKKFEKTTDSSAHKGAVPTQLSSSSTSKKKVGSIFDRQDESPLHGGGGGGGSSSGLKELERRQAERRKELMKPKSSVTPTRQAVIQKLERAGGGTGLPVSQVCKISRSPGSGVPNSKNVKQMLLDWCRAKTHSYENVNIQNFSSSWSDGLAFCALVHHFFPHAFDYSSLRPTDRRHNFETAFSSAETLADCPALLDVEDMVRMHEPDWKCVYTYIQEFYRNLVQKGLVKTKKSC
ncbi:smoothelin isoform X1 [Anguilla anguilla]|uniref:smoothelin isoform X1 n=1 Tax=Anguilla anguilla TaxID=7936 RepID=UPI0015AF5972|nr:smoothelin isoform X1 [Anguilla anguilla]XP_035245769.1 smoothelin isoform X1 [Anguilla anguilla]XP_035245770.1 smoothelin isoform X1 [Anguilla anguilla]XP_035245771.1 smoothelin isoform X1 [Anguilla anguilla]